MNIIVPYSWLKEFLETNATPQKIGECLSLSSQSVEKMIPFKNDWLYDIEITTNRPDCLSVYGIARELAAILPRFGFRAKLKDFKTSEKKALNSGKPLPLEVKISQSSLCPRFTALIFDQVVVKPSPKIVQERLEKCGIRAINNVVDVSNYLMLELGQPMHTFDYDKIKGAKMILRESAGGEKVTTLDGQTRALPDGTIIIEDGEGRIIDLCGIMGGANSEVDQQTKRVLLFVQTYDPVKIRQTCQKLSFRTDAASRFEKGVDPEGVLLAMGKAIRMLEQTAQAKIASHLIDFYPQPPKPKSVVLKLSLVEKIMGIEILPQEMEKVLQSLGFKIKKSEKDKKEFLIPHWRYGDINIAQDLIEEFARIYGYHRLPSCLPPLASSYLGNISSIEWASRIKEALKFWGFTETINYSMTSEESLKRFEIKPEDCLKINNALSDDWLYLRPSLIPSLLEVAAKNPEMNLRIFEQSNVYIPLGEHELPEENLMLTGLLINEDFRQGKGMVEAILDELGIDQYEVKSYNLQKTFYGKTFNDARLAELVLKNNSLGIFGEIKKEILARFGIKGKVFIFDLDFKELAKAASNKKEYRPIPKYPPVIEDFSFVLPPKTYLGEIIKTIKGIDLIIKSVDLIDSFEDTRTLRIVYQDKNKTLTDQGVEKIREKIIKTVEEKFKAKIKGKN
jgi:phenylalanyl-tRNA synthetase beta chain